MSFFHKLAQQKEDISLIESVVSQLEILFSNRYDQYWAYNFKTNKIFAMHEVFAMNYFSPEFERKLEEAIKVFDSRICDVTVKVSKMQDSAKIAIEAIACHLNEKVELPEMNFML